MRAQTLLGRIGFIHNHPNSTYQISLRICFLMVLVFLLSISISIALSEKEPASNSNLFSPIGSQV